MPLTIIGWNEKYENNRTRELKRMDWVPVPNRMDGSGYTELLDHPNGPAHFAAWIAILEIASKQTMRGTIPQDGAALCGMLARISRIPRSVFEEVLPRLQQIQWIEPHRTIPHDGAGIPHDGAEECLRARAGVPFPSVLFNSIPLSEEKKDAPVLRGNASTDLSPQPPVAFQRWELDEQYCQFRASYEASGMVPSPADWAEGHASWGALDWEQRLKAIDHARSADGAFIRLPWKYLRFHDWERKARPPAKPASPKEKPMADQLRELGYGD